MEGFEFDRIERFKRDLLLNRRLKASWRNGKKSFLPLDVKFEKIKEKIFWVELLNSTVVKLCLIIV